MFIAREAELSFLEDRYRSDKAELIVLYGRRRLGKTETLKEFCKNKDHVFYACRECADTEQLKSFSQRMLKPGMPIARYVSVFKDWQQAFSAITELPGADKKLLVVDEFPYMAKANSSIASTLQNLWDEKLKDQNVMLILCGSSMSFIEDELLAEKNPLYGRATGVYKMTEMSYLDAAKFFPDYSNEDKLAAYAILGGVPHYLRQFDSRLSLAENIKQNILTKGTVLYSEVEFLMRQEFRETALYNTIVEAVALGNTRLNDIYNKTGIEKTKLAVYIKNLIDLGIMQREFSVDIGTKESANTGRGLYKLSDNFFGFWYRFGFGNVSELEGGDVDGVYEYSIAPELNQYISIVFENVCRAYLRKKNMAGELPFRYTKIGRYFDKSTEIDIVALSNDKKKVLLGECKYRNIQMDSSDLNKLKEKNLYNAEAWYYLFSKGGFSKGIQASERVNCISIDELF